MARKLYYQDSYGRWHQDKTAGHPRGLPGGFMVKVLMWLAIAVVIASFIGH
jgi:hypothetical protein